ncbi:hypothetical protein [Phnomibacter sp. MR]|uniref:hypothetical protein n=1 Tax=Phnomibacter sp. MR TaxID=3042318 RepID=UPI003A805D6B
MMQIQARWPSAAGLFLLMYALLLMGCRMEAVAAPQQLVALIAVLAGHYKRTAGTVAAICTIDESPK